MEAQTSKSLTNKVFNQALELLISHKSFLEIMLQQIKNYLNHFITKKQNLKNIKQYLISIKSNLSTILKDKINILIFFENEISPKKLKMQQQLYGKILKKNIEKHLDNFKNINNMNYIQNNQIIKSNNKIINFINEKRQLENLSFYMENEIKKIEFEIEKKIDVIIKLKTLRLNQEEDLEIVAEQNSLKLIAERIIKKNLTIRQKKLLKTIKEKIKKDEKLKFIQEEIENIKQQIKNFENIDTDNIIFEESSAFEKSIIGENNIIMHNNLDNKDKNKYNIYNFCYNRERKENRHSLGLDYNINDNFNINNNKDNSKIYLNNINKQIKSKIIRSLSSKINKFNLKNNNCKFNINFNFNVNNLNIINGPLRKDKNEDDYKESLNLTDVNNEINAKKILKKDHKNPK